MRVGRCTSTVGGAGVAGKEKVCSKSGGVGRGVRNVVVKAGVVGVQQVRRCAGACGSAWQRRC